MAVKVEAARQGDALLLPDRLYRLAPVRIGFRGVEHRRGVRLLVYVPMNEQPRAAKSRPNILFCYLA